MRNSLLVTLISLSLSGCSISMPEPTSKEKLAQRKKVPAATKKSVAPMKNCFFDWGDESDQIAESAEPSSAHNAKLAQHKPAPVAAQENTTTKKKVSFFSRKKTPEQVSTANAKPKVVATDPSDDLLKFEPKITVAKTSTPNKNRFFDWEDDSDEVAQELAQEAIDFNIATATSVAKEKTKEQKLAQHKPNPVVVLEAKITPKKAENLARKQTAEQMPMENPKPKVVAANEPDDLLKFEPKIAIHAETPFYQTGDDVDAKKTFEQLHAEAIKGDVHAFTRVGEMYLTGQGVQQNLSEAIVWYRRAADLDIAVAELKLGDLYRDGVGVPKSNPEAIKLYTRAANQGDIKAMLRLGELYKGWYGNAFDRQLSFKWYRQAANLGSDEARTQLHLLLANNIDKQPVQSDSGELSKTARAGNSKEMLRLGNYYYEGRGGKRDMVLAIQYFKRAAAAGSADAAYKLGNIYFYGDSVTPNAKQAKTWYMTSARLGMAQGYFRVGEMYYKGQGIPADVSIARDWFLKSAEKNYAPAEDMLGDMYHSGRGAPRYLPRAVYWYEKAGRQGDPYAQFMLSVMYLKGRGVQPDLAKSVEWYNLAVAQQDSFVAQAQVAKNYEYGYGLPRDGIEAIRWYEYASKAGYAPAQTSLGDIYSTGILVPQDLELAYNYYLDAAQSHYPYGEYSVGLAMLEGKGTDQELKDGAKWIKRAAYQGFRPAQYELGRLYLHGIGLGRNDVRAYGWLSISIQDTTDMTPTILSNLVNRMDPDYRNRAVKLANRYKEKFENKEVIID